MSRKLRHIHARSDEWVVVHRPPPIDQSGCLWLIIGIIILRLLSCLGGA